jgi:GMP synthase (glutamine-hydrolysing)
MRILVLESNTPDMVAAARAAGKVTSGERYGVALRAVDSNVEIQICEPYAAPLKEEALAWADGFALTGSGVNWSTDAPEAALLRAAGERVLDTGKPVIGSCNGLQLAAVLLGGAVGLSPNGMEIGLALDIGLTDAGQHHAMTAGRVNGYCVPCIHRDEVQRLPAGAVLIAQNAHSPVQAMTYNVNGVDFWGMQYHPELTLAWIADSVGGGKGLFVSGADLAADLRVAEEDDAAAVRLGALRTLLDAETRTLELRNWLLHVSGRLR